MVWNKKVVGWTTSVVAVSAFVLLWWMSDVYNWRLPGWFVGLIGFFSVGFLFRIYIMWTNREHLRMVYDIAKYSFTDIKLKKQLKKEDEEEKK